MLLAFCRPCFVKTSAAKCVQNGEVAALYATDNQLSETAQCTTSNTTAAVNQLPKTAQPDQHRVSWQIAKRLAALAVLFAASEYIKHAIAPLHSQPTLNSAVTHAAPCPALTQLVLQRHTDAAAYLS